jgi:phospholipase/lecithinase/hemolysin
MVMFGDSLSDIGNVYDQTFHIAPQSPPYFDGRYSNGPLWVERLADGLNLAAPNYSRDGGKDYAYAGVKTGGGSTFIFPFSFPNLGSQINSYLQNNTPTPTELFTVWGGGNDFIDGQTNPAIPVNNLVNHVTALANAGAKNIVVPNLPPLGFTPRFRGTANESVMNTRTTQFNSQLATAMTTVESSLNINIFQLDVAGFFAQALANPASFGLTNVTGTALVGNTPAPNQDEYLFWDDIHPTRVGHQLLGTLATTLVNTHSWASSSTAGDWSTSTNWDPGGVPAPEWIARVVNVQPSQAQAVDVAGNSSVQSILVAGSSARMTLQIQSAVTLTATSVTVGANGQVELLGGALNSPTILVNAGGSLGGSGVVTGNLTSAGGTISPGDPGTPLSVTGDYNSGPASVIEIDLVDEFSADWLAVHGTATLDGELHVRLADGFVALPAWSYEVLTFGARVGDVTVVNDTGFAGLGFTKSYSSSALQIDTTGLPGDANLDAAVNSDDFNILATSFGLTGQTWLDADFTGDSLVNSDDFNLLASNFGLSASTDGPTPQDWSILAAAVPEPSSLLLAGLAASVAIMSRRKRHLGVAPAGARAATCA